jgi:hypothetical protein
MSENPAITFRLPNDSLWSYSITPETRVSDVITLLSSHWHIPPENVSIWERKLELGSQAKLHLCIHPKTKQSPILSVRVHIGLPKPPQPAQPAQPATPEPVDISTIDSGEQERILHRIRQAQIDENLRQAQQMNREHRIGQRTRTILCKIHGKTLRMLVDTGASVSILYMNQVELCSVRYLVDEREPCKIHLVGVGGTKHQAIGVIHSLEIMVGDVKTFGTVAVLDQSEVAGLLGIDWLRQNNAIIRVTDDTMEIDGKVVQFEDSPL